MSDFTKEAAAHYADILDGLCAELHDRAAWTPAEIAIRENALLCASRVMRGNAALARSVDGLSGEAEVAWPEKFAALVAQLEESAKTYGYWNTLRDTDEATIEYWRDRTADLRARVLTAITANAKEISP